MYAGINILKHQVIQDN